ncbi:cytochrome-c oxidase, cbb3-type subunit III [Novosphingobium mangrovi (ex Huang et al. 2023)]|uniref:Cbb3-type cytochrome c oxidase subunit n=1 Tax=Novosphingobium mangrovi (ex Huang et al. 2023) TaxID=2976432 RepID=A0ABT2I1D3_9SPHN|nr:cytochrome-c oxidase, cbb3-type subunit III [Novosphingobium mangrovi (ex Huang et al. 2023)]MCT2398612.1 cytochrome-c oxidase, cbb3-type subunit III [Novosphingobium mangrovi (ex Huang et al. 2023)]
MANKRVDEATNTETVGHEWDGIEELNTPLPRWWLWSFYACIVFAIGYSIAYPAWPLVHKATAGVLGWTSRGQLDQELKEAAAERAKTVAALKDMPIEQLPEHPELMHAAVAGGEAAFKVNCVQCHGAGAAGSNGFPNLNDDDWLWGGDLKTIETTLIHGVRQPGDDQTRMSQMPAFGRDGLLTASQIQDVTSFVLSLSGREKASAASQRGKVAFEANCAVCHGPDGKGSRQFGAPNLADAIWLYAGTREAVASQIGNPRHGVMPAWGTRLDPVTIKMLAAYVHSRGGGEEFTPPPVAETQAEATTAAE